MVDSYENVFYQNILYKPTSSNDISYSLCLRVNRIEDAFPKRVVFLSAGTFILNFTGFNATFLE